MRTMIIALAVSVSDSDTINLPKAGTDGAELSRFLTWSGHDISVVGVLDPNRPENNDEPQIFAAHEPNASVAGGGDLRCAC